MNGVREFTDLDLQLMHILQIDGRRSSTDIGRELGISESTVRRRIEWLTQNGYIQISAICDPIRIGLSVWAMVQMQVDLTHIEAVAEGLAKFPEVTYVAVTTGAFDILFTAIFESHADLYSFMTKKLATFAGVKSTATSTVLRITKRGFTIPNPRVHHQSADA